MEGLLSTHDVTTCSGGDHHGAATAVQHCIETASRPLSAGVDSIKYPTESERQPSSLKTDMAAIDLAKNVPLPEVSEDALDPASQTVILASNADEMKKAVHDADGSDIVLEITIPSSPDNSDIDESHTPDSSREYHSCNEESKEPLAYSTTWTEIDEINICQPFNYVMALPGKNFRSQMLSAFNVWFKVDDESFKIIDRIVSMLHNASLLIDDIQDGSVLRRGSPAAHCLFGVPQTINAANYAYFIAQQELMRLPDPFEAFRVFTEEAINLHRGQGLELFWRDTMTVPTEEEYIKMVSNKTGGLIRLAVRLLQSASSVKLDILPVTELIGRIFQIRDDYNNLCSEKVGVLQDSVVTEDVDGEVQIASTKGQCEDLTEGKFSFPIIHGIRSGPSRNNAVLNILRLRTTDPALKEYVVWYLRTQSHSLQYTLDTLGRLHREAKMALQRIEAKNEAVGRLLSALSPD